MEMLRLDEVGALLEATPVMLRVQLDRLDDRVLCWRPAPGEWCIKEVIGHLIETDRIAFWGRIRQMREEDYPILSGMDVNAVAAARRDDQWPVDDLLNELSVLRAEIGPMVAGLSPADLARKGRYPKLGGDLSVQDLVYEWPFHDANHIKQIQDILQAWALPGMGELMRAAVTS